MASPWYLDHHHLVILRFSFLHHCCPMGSTPTGSGYMMGPPLGCIPMPKLVPIVPMPKQHDPMSNIPKAFTSQLTSPFDLSATSQSHSLGNFNPYAMTTTSPRTWIGSGPCPHAARPSSCGHLPVPTVADHARFVQVGPQQEPCAGSTPRPSMSRRYAQQVLSSAGMRSKAGVPSSAPSLTVPKAKASADDRMVSFLAFH